jgi:hypothetical protein
MREIKIYFNFSFTHKTTLLRLHAICFHRVALHASKTLLRSYPVQDWGRCGIAARKHKFI